MLKTYITTVPLQGKLDPMLYQRDHAAPPTATCFPIVQVMRDTLEPGDTVQLLAIRQENADTARNYQRLLEELAQLGIAENQVRQLHLPEDQRPETLIGPVQGIWWMPCRRSTPGVCLHHLRIQEHPGGHADGIDLRRSYPYGAGSRRRVLW